MMLLLMIVPMEMIMIMHFFDIQTQSLLLCERQEVYND